MALKINTKAPDFTLDGTGGKFTLSQDLANKPCVLYFYPKDFTAVCTKEACEFRDQFAEFRGAEIDVIGISRDSVETHERFKKEHQLPFELLADKSGQVAKKYKALIPVIGVTKRITYFLDKDHQIKAVFENMFDADGHIKAMIQQLKSS